MGQLKKILLVDDDEDLREALSEQLVMTEDFDVFEAGSGADAMIKAKEGLYDLVILDVGLPDTDGRELCRLMRKQGVKSPILMLTGHDTDADTILGLDAGANDYVSKPFKFPVLLARIRAQLRQHEQSEDAVFTLGPYTFKPAMKMLITEEDRKIRLTEKETNILKFLYRATEGVVARDVLLPIGGDRVSIEGDIVWLPSRQALSFAMAFYELATNAVKYGALSTPEGRVALRWDRAEPDHLAIQWTETGGPPPAEPTEKGFGSFITNRALRMETTGTIVSTYPPTGLQWRLDMPLAPVDPPPDEK